MAHPEFFYKYTSPETTLRVLTSGRLRWSSPFLFNDVAEFQRMPRFEPTISEAYTLLPRLLVEVARGHCELDHKRLSPAASAALFGAIALLKQGKTDEEVIHSMTVNDPNADLKVEHSLRMHFESLDITKARVLCVTTDPLNDAMWANYGSNHTGCVLGFGHIPQMSTPLLEAVEVSYESGRPIAGSGLDFLLYGDSESLRKRTSHAVCFTKKSSWSYEKEWRAITWRDDGADKQHGDYPFLPAELVSVSLGCRSTDATLTEVRNLLAAQYPHAKLFKLAVHRGDLVQMSVNLPRRDA